ncbi:hypothetical protein BDR26DRAFT_918317 [Obelidium mucronatum]|nr:hypothetical protein BDR26DRAFT_918317 [Obelidium mucronatum]
MLATAEDIHAEQPEIVVKTMSLKELVHGADLPDEDIEDFDYEVQMAENDNEDSSSDSDSDEEHEDNDTEAIDADEVCFFSFAFFVLHCFDSNKLNKQPNHQTRNQVNDINMEHADLHKAKVLRSGLRAAEGRGGVTIHDIVAGDDEDDDEYELRDDDGAADSDSQDDGADDDGDDDDEDDEDDVDEDEVKAMIVNAPHLPSKDATVLRDGKEIPAAESDIDLVARMQQLMQQ